MKRRDFFRLTASAWLAGTAGTRRPRLHAQAAAVAAGSGTLKVDIYSRHLQWLRSTDEVADAVALKDIHFAGPIEIQAEYPNGGADNAQDRITLPREQVLGAMKRDLLTLRRGLAGYSPA